MRTIIVADTNEISRRAAAIVAKQVRSKPDSVLGLPTGTTPEGMYRELVRMHKEEGLDFSLVSSFNLDEYWGLEPSHPQSYHRFMREHLFRHVNCDPRNARVPDGRRSDVEASCREYEAQIRAAGGVDLQILGIGGDGHLAFAEPGASLAGRTSLVALAMETIRDNSRLFSSIDEVPRYAVTMGIGTILEARKCLLLAAGIHKAKAIRNAIEGPITSLCPASSLQAHPDTIAIIDEDAADLLELKDHYLYVEHLLDVFERDGKRIAAAQAAAGRREAVTLAHSAIN